MTLLEILNPQTPAPIHGARLVVGRASMGSMAPWQAGQSNYDRSEKAKAIAREYQRQRRARMAAAGLTTKGKPRVG